MTGLRNFNVPVWEIFAGNLLLFICFLFYLVWWIVSFRPGSSGASAGVFYITVAFVTGIAAIFLLTGGINSLSQDSKSVPVKLILFCGIALFLILLFVTSFAFHRTVTSELMIIHAWVALELSVIVVLYGTDHFTPVSAVLLAVLVGIAFVISMICYVLYYRLDAVTSYWVGMLPLSMAAFVVAILLGRMAVL